MLVIHGGSSVSFLFSFFILFLLRFFRILIDRRLTNMILKTPTSENGEKEAHVNVNTDPTHG